MYRMYKYQNHNLHIENVSLAAIAAQIGTPCYIYSKNEIEAKFIEFQQVLNDCRYPYKIYYAVKANSNLAILRLLAQLGAGFDTVSGGEIERVFTATGKASNVLFSGVGKSSVEIRRAIQLGIESIHIESIQELERVQSIAQQLNNRMKIAIRVNPNISIESYPYISTGKSDNKFGVEYDQAFGLYKQASSMSHIECVGIACHIGSQIMDVEPYLLAIEQLLALVERLQHDGIKLQYIDIGGGFGVRYNNEQPPSIANFLQLIVDKIRPSGLELHIEPGRSLVANAGLLLTTIEYIKENQHTNFAIVDAAMNDLIRPALYDSYHEVMLVNNQERDLIEKLYQIVGPVCESGDFLARDRKFKINPGDMLAILGCGAYGFSMSSNYNSRPRCAEIMVDGDIFKVIRRRESLEQLWQLELDES